MIRPHSHRFAWFLVLALAAGPALAARDVLLVLDNSGSMRRNDPQRLAAPAVTEFIKSQPPDTRVGILLYGSEAELVLPLMPSEIAADGEAQKALRKFTYSGKLTQTAGAIERALYELRSEGRPGVPRAIVLMTDGLLDAGSGDRTAELNRWLRQDLMPQARREGVRIFGIAFTEQADYELLQSLASATDAQYFRVLSAEGIGKALKGIEAGITAEAGKPQVAPPPASAPAPSAAPAVPPPSAETAPEGAKPEASSLGWLAGLVALLVVLLGGFAGVFAWRRRAAGETLKVKRDAGPIGVLYDNVERHELGSRPVIIGRAGGSDPERYYIVVPEKTVGRWHATIERRGQTFWIRDEGSVNGTFINGERVVGERPLKHRDTVRFHTHPFEFEIPELADADRTLLQPTPRGPLN
jgi:hypothetical protein